MIAATDGLLLSLRANTFWRCGTCPGWPAHAQTLAYIDILGGLAVIVFGLGWIKPILLTSSTLPSKLWDAIAIVLAGPLAGGAR